ncbi:MAG: hypothetical protein H6730_21320 [Deltaproteobacteria bacterium]|nr:hypothetical protein [Deltaproteobacteria bacterium]
MRPARVTLLILVAATALILGYAGYRTSAPELARKPDVKITNRVWVNKVPKNDRDVVTYFVLLDRMKQRVGALAHVSAWRLYADRLRFRLDGSTLVLESPQEQATTKFKVRTWACPKEAPKPYDLCMELSQGSRKIVLYSERSAAFVAPAWAEGAALGPCEGCTEGDLTRLFDAE